MSNKQKLVGNLKRGRIFVVSAPAGTGKTTLVSMLTKEFDHVKMSISCTTRSPRPYEIDGVHYHFLSKEAFQEKIQRGEFVEHVELYGDYYGTSFKSIEEMLMKGLHVVLVIDTQGAIMLREKIDAAYIFILPPSKEELQRRLESRGTEKRDVMLQRLAIAEREMNEAYRYDYQIINDDLSCAYQVLRSIVIAEEHKTRTVT
jgi:guanylate kinase